MTHLVGVGGGGEVRGEKCQSENGRKHVSDKEKAAPGILEPR